MRQKLPGPTRLLVYYLLSYLLWPCGSSNCSHTTEGVNKHPYTVAINEACKEDVRHIPERVMHIPEGDGGNFGQDPEGGTASVNR